MHTMCIHASWNTESVLVVGATAALAPAHHLSHPFIAPTGTGAVAAAGPGRDDDDMRQMVMMMMSMICFVSHAPVAECFGGAPAQTHTTPGSDSSSSSDSVLPKLQPNLLPDHRCETTSILLTGSSLKSFHCLLGVHGSLFPSISLCDRR